MNGRTIFRVAAIAFAVTAIAVAVSQGQHSATRHAPPPRAAPATRPIQPDLARCQALGEAGANDPGCLKAWADQRAKFLGLSTPAAER
jgi:conjugative transfer region protein TrbK